MMRNARSNSTKTKTTGNSNINRLKDLSSKSTPIKKSRKRPAKASFYPTFVKCACLVLILLISMNVAVLLLEQPFNYYSGDNSELFRRTQTNLHEGRTLRDTLQRILSRKIAASNVLIITPDAGAVKEVITKFEGGAGVLVHETAKREGHSVHALKSSNVNVDAWWKYDHDRANQNWFLLAFICGDLRHEYRKHTEDVDRIMRSANLFLSEATVTYMVLEVGVLSASSDLISGGEQIIGRDAVEILLDRKYKVQILVSSHFLDASWGPNALLTSHNVDAFFQDAARLVRKGGETFSSYLFATQGLDLAIPAIHGTALWDYDNTLCGPLSNDCGNGNCGIYANLELGIRPSCPAEHSRSRIDFKSEIYPGDNRTRKHMASLEVKYDGKVISKETEDVKVWLSNAKQPERAEAACMRVNPGASYTKQPSVACTTRIIKEQQQQQHKNKQSSNKSVNVLSILIDPISRTQFLRSLPRTTALLEEKHFFRFDKYTVVGANSGPNQAALFSGVPLTNGRNGISSSASHGKPGTNATRTQWIWDELRSSGYVTFKAEDGCIENSNMIQSLKPNVTHGSALHRMFCYSFDRPNCLGEKLAAEHLFDTAEKFIDAYSGEQPWAAFLSLTDSHEDSLSMIQILDDVMHKFISSLDLSNTFVMVLSDHGLHYGPHFQSPAGLKERAQPILYMHLPGELQSKFSETMEKNAKLWTSHFDVHETLVDVALGIYNEGAVGSSLLKPLTTERLKCHGASGIPSEYCDIVDGSDESDVTTVQLACQNMPPPPSPLTFLADIPIHRQPKLTCSKRAGKKKTLNLPLRKSASKRSIWTSSKRSLKKGSCKCATESSNGWYDCQRHPWHERKEFDDAVIGLTYCEGGNGKVDVEVDIRIELDQGKKSNSRKKSMIRDRRSVSELSTGLLTVANQFLQRQMLCADSIISNLKVSAPLPVSWSVHTV